MSFLSSLLAWANVPFTIALGVALVFAALQMSGLLGLIAGGGDHEGDHEHDVDGGDHEADADGDHEADADHDHDQDQDNDEQSGSQGFLAGLGVGKVPLSIIWQTYAVTFAFAGLAANAVYLGRAGALPLVTLAWTLPGGLVFGYVVTRSLGRVLARVVADPRQEATSRKQLVGHSGVVISTKVNGEFGEVRIKDKTGHVVRIVCRTREADPIIPEGREVVIVDYDAARDQLYVAPLDGDDDQPSRKQLAP